MGAIIARSMWNLGGSRAVSRNRFANCAWIGGLVLFVVGGCTPISKRQSGSEGEAEGEQSSGVIRRLGECREDIDCPVYSPCLAVRCEQLKCVEQPEEMGTVLPDDQQMEGDCKTLTCDGRGQVRKRPDDSDKPTSDTDSCHTVECLEGQLKRSNAPDGAPCNQTGVCAAGSCSVCLEGKDCTRADDCTVHRYTCTGGEEKCEDTGIELNGKVCGAGKVCVRASCAPCVIGALCNMVDSPCHEGRIVGCENGIDCQPQPVTGPSPSCGKGPDGRMRYCIDGNCEDTCREGTCSMSPPDACQEARLVCATNAEPDCVMVPREDGASCGDASRCHGGKCLRTALNNGDFTRGLEGWTSDGDAAQFVVGGRSDARRTLSTGVGSSRGAAMGTLTQSFTVPDDALALHFAVAGGHAHVRLKSADGNVLHECIGRESNDRFIPVHWPLSDLRGQRLTIAVEDDVSDGEWAFVTTTGFDVIRESEKPLRNPQFTRALDDWETTGDGLHFYVYDAYAYYTGSGTNSRGEEMYGLRRAITTYVRDDGATASGIASRGTLSQTFIVPNDAVALRFHTCGGRNAQVKLESQGQTIYTAAGLDMDERQVVVDWPLQALRGKMVRLLVEDNAGVGIYDYVGTSGFDLITGYNGP